MLGALALGAAAVWLVVQPLVGGRRLPAPGRDEPPEFEETPKGVALAALKEIEFDRETGKLSDADYQFLRAKYTAVALEALRLDDGPRTDAGRADAPLGDGSGGPPDPGDRPDPIEAIVAARRQALAGGGVAAARSCPACGPRPEPDASFCSDCGSFVGPPGSCERCGDAVPAGGRYCASCGARPGS